jgi:hypothetical protein
MNEAGMSVAGRIALSGLIPLLGSERLTAQPAGALAGRVLSQPGLPRSEFLTGLLFFNAGVELGQLTVILAAFLLIGPPFSKKLWYHRRVVAPLSLAIAAVGLYWAATRAISALRG